jgi:predicted lipoprotein with Yx(FWY)xxD motif
MMKRTGIFLISTAFMISTAVAQMAPAKIGDTSKGKALVNDKGMTLYIFDKDKDVPGKPACNGPCADNWGAHFRATYHGVRSVLIAFHQKYEMLSFACAE